MLTGYCFLANYRQDWVSFDYLAKTWTKTMSNRNSRSASPFWGRSQPDPKKVTRDPNIVVGASYSHADALKLDSLLVMHEYYDHRHLSNYTLDLFRPAQRDQELPRLLLGRKHPQGGDWLLLLEGHIRTSSPIRITTGLQQTMTMSLMMSTGWITMTGTILAYPVYRA